jgi:glucuronoarabinoxylan endo-1,4-beta-xylanase
MVRPREAQQPDPVADRLLVRSARVRPSEAEALWATVDTIVSFVADYMGPAMADSGVKLMPPETQNWCGFKTFWPLIKANSKAMSYFSIIATHEYGCSATAYPDIAQAAKELWETEIYDTTGSSTGIDSGRRTAQLIHDALTVANMNAWHCWWVYATDGKGGLFNNNQPTKRLWVEGNYSRFVRPGFQRVSTSGSVSSVLLTAFRNPSDGTVVVVAANKGSGAANLSVFPRGWCGSGAGSPHRSTTRCEWSHDSG